MRIYVYIYIYIYGHPPPSTDPGIVFPICPGSGGGGKSTTPKFLEFPKIQKSKNPNPSFGFLETRGICSKSKKNPKFLEFPKIQKSKNPNPIFGFLETRGILGFFLDFEKLEEARNFGFFWILSKFLEFPKIRNWGWDFWIFGFLETRGILGFFGF